MEEKIANMRKFSSANQGNNSFLASSTTFDVFDAMDCSRDVQRSNNFEFYRAMDGECVDRSFEAELTNDMRKKFRKGWRKRGENVAKMPSAKRISKWKRILCPPTSSFVRMFTLVEAAIRYCLVESWL